MSSKRVYLMLVALVCVLFGGLLFGTYQINTMLTKKGADLTKLKAKTQALEQEQQTLVHTKENIAKYEELYEITRAVVPEDKSQAEAVRELVSIANKNQIALSSVTFPASTLGSGSSSKSKSSASEKKAALSQLSSVKGIPGVYSLTITVTSDSNKPVPYDKFLNFLQDLEQNRRTAQVSTISIQPKEDDRNLLSFTLTLNGYIKP